MDWKKYTYTCNWIEKFGFIEKRPLISISLIYGEKIMPQLAMIDSGSHSIVASEDIAQFLGINKDDCEKFQVAGITGQLVEGFSCVIDLQVDQFDSIVKVPVIFVPGLKVNLLLGQRGFFEKFDINFEYQKSNFSLLPSMDETKKKREKGKK